MQANKWKGIITLFIFLVLLGGSFFLVSNRVQTNIAPADSSAIYGGQIETGYPFAGYMLAYKDDGKVVICSVTYLSANVALSAAHCTHKEASTFVGEGQFKYSPDGNYQTQTVATKEGWDWKTSNNDLGYMLLPDAGVPLKQFAELASPQLGCNYIVVGYGRTENDAAGINPDRPRKSTRVCITKIENDLVSLIGSGGGICFGDSGSPIFEAGTNKIIGVISAITPGEGETQAQCRVDNTAVAVRVDRNTAFINKAGPIGTLVSTNQARCNESCSNRSCAGGLLCGSATLCELPLKGGCRAVLGEFCDEQLGVSCSDGSTCLAQKCRDIPRGENNDLGSLVQGFLAELTTGNRIFAVIGGLMILAAVVIIIRMLRPGPKLYTSSAYGQIKRSSHVIADNSKREHLAHIPVLNQSNLLAPSVPLPATAQPVVAAPAVTTPKPAAAATAPAPTAATKSGIANGLPPLTAAGLPPLRSTSDPVTPSQLDTSLPPLPGGASQ